MAVSGRELVLEAFLRKGGERPPWVPFTGVHAGALAGFPADEYLRDAAKIVKGIETAYDLYRPDGLPVLFDLQIEAEILGCNLRWAKDAPPAVTSHPLEHGYEALSSLKIPEADQGRIPIALAATRELAKTIGKSAALFGLITGPFTLAAHLRGVNIFLDMFDAPEQLHRLMEFGCRVAKRMAQLYVEAGVDVVAVVDPMISQISPEHFREFVHDPASDVFAYIRSAGKASSFFVCGNATSVLEAMAECSPDGIAVDENVSMDVAKDIADRHGISFAGNIPLTTVMLFGSEMENMRTVLELTDKYTGPGFVLSPGCDIPYNVPLSNISALTMAIHDPAQARKLIAAETDESAGSSADINLPDYDNLERPLVEVITLDSDTCPPCKYMVDATREVAKSVPGGIDWVEHKITSPENVARMQLLGVTNIPSIVINGEVAFSSRIPDLTSFRRAIQERLERRLEK